jgi:hypothetical protein
MRAYDSQAVLAASGRRRGLGRPAGVVLANHANANDRNFNYTGGLWRDLPYSDLQATTGAPNLIADMNDSDIEFSVHDGDLKAGSGAPGSATSTTCSDAMYLQAAADRASQPNGGAGALAS